MADTSPIVVGIDPGFSGGLAAMTLTGAVVRTTTMPTMKAVKGNELDMRAIAEWFDGLAKRELLLVAIEKVGPRPTDGSIQAFKFGYFFGKIVGFVEVTRRSLQLVTPQTWQKAILQGTAAARIRATGKEQQTTKQQTTKQLSIAYVRKRHPNLDLRATPRCSSDHDGIADAVCLAEWARRNIVGTGAETPGNK